MYEQNQDYNINLTPDNQQYQLREYEWYAVEGKIRKLVNQLVQPTLKQIAEDRQSIDNLSVILDSQNETVNRLKDLFLNNSQNIPIFQEIDEKILKLDQKIIDNGTFICKELEGFQYQLKNFQYSLQENKQIFDNTSKYKDQMLQNIDQLKNQIDNSQLTLEKGNLKLISRLSAFEILCKQNVDQMQVDIKTLQGQQKDVYQQIKYQDDKIFSYISQQVESTKVLSESQHQFDIIKRQQRDISNNLQVTKRFIGKVQELQSDINKYENYMLVYNPLTVQQQISETLFPLLNYQNAKILVNHDQKFFNQYSDGLFTKQDGKQNGLNKSIEDIQLFITDLNQKNSEIMQKFQQKEDYEKSHELEQEGEQQDQKESKIQKHQKESPEMAPFEIKLMQSEIQYNIMQQLEGIKRGIDERIENMYKNVIESELNIQLEINNIKNKIEQQSIKINQFQKDTQIQYGNIDHKIIKFYGELSKIVNNFNALSDSVKKVIHYNTLINQIYIQDEIDRNQMTLYGGRKEASDIKELVEVVNQSPQKVNLSTFYSNAQVFDKQQNNIFQLDKSCISCSGQQAILTKLFKIACLAYTPSIITVEGQQYRREEVLEIATKILQRARDSYHQEQGNVQSFSPVQQNQQSVQKRCTKPGKLKPFSRSMLQKTMEKQNLNNSFKFNNTQRDTVSTSFQ